jgi:hypothetical protein
MQAPAISTDLDVKLTRENNGVVFNGDDSHP